MRRLTPHVVPVTFSALGMLAGLWLGRAGLLSAAQADARPEALADTVSASRFELVDAEGRPRILMAASREGSPGIWFLDRKGKVRLNLGLYGDDNAFIVLNDEQERAVEILRTMGPRSAPFLVMKAEGRDRLVMGLSGAGQDAFLVHYDTNGQKQAVFGSWP
jgi:hypothetical protein